MNAEFCSHALKSVLSWQGYDEKQSLSITQQLDIWNTADLYSRGKRAVPSLTNRGLMDIKCDNSSSTNRL